MNINININTEVLDELNKYLENLKKSWDKNNPQKSSWVSLNKTQLINCTIFLITALDDLIVYVQGVIPKGSDKKTAVTAVLSNAFDYIVVQAFPAWLRPFAPTIKQIIIGIIISQLIDFIVAKYKEGSWKMESKNE
jgi:hypothetical protein